MEQYTDIALTSTLDANGTPTGNVIYLAGATITVRDSNGDIATIYSDDGLTLKANPFTADTDGEYAFFAANGVYSITVAKTGYITDTKSDLTLYDPNDVWPDATLPLDDADLVAVLQGTSNRHAAVSAVRNSIASTALEAQSAAELAAAQAAASAAEAALTSPSGSFAEMLAVPTPEQGEAFLVTSGVGNRSNWWFYDAIRAAWYPLENRLVLAAAVGTKASPLGSSTGVTAATKLLAVTIPANVLRVGCEVRVWATITREGSTDISLVQARLGTTNAATDDSGGSVSFTASNPSGGQAIRPLTQFFVQSATQFLAGGWMSLSGSSGSSTIAENTTNFDIASPMYLGWYTGGTINVADTHKLLAYSIEVFYGV